MLVFAPASAQESVDLIALAFDKADEYRNPTMILSDASIAQMMEPVTLPEMHEHDPNADWAVCAARQGGEFKRVTSTMYYIEDFDAYIKNKYDTMAENEQRWESVQVEDAEPFSWPTASAPAYARKPWKMHAVRASSLACCAHYFMAVPVKGFADINPEVKAFLSVELSSLPKMEEDVKLACNMKAPVETSSAAQIFRSPPPSLNERSPSSRNRGSPMSEKRIPKLLVEPNKFCPGCGHGIINRVVAEVLEEMGLADQTVGSLAVGCACLMMDTFGTDWIQARMVVRPP